MSAWKKKGAATAVALIASGALTLLSPDLQKMLSRWEGDGQNVVYPDRLANGLPTVCRGLTKHTAPEPLVVGDYWSPQKCEEIERIVVERGQIDLAACLPATIKQKPFDAVSDMGHHFGNPRTCASRAVGLMWEGRWQEACEAFAHAPNGRPVWSYVGTTLYRGLYDRAKARRSLCLAGLN